MPASGVFRDAREFGRRLVALHARRRRIRLNRDPAQNRRVQLSPLTRAAILEKTGARCHVCGGVIRPDEAWCADHVFPHVSGGTSRADNFLPAHTLCNSYRWYYGPEEMQWILKLGVWFRSRIEQGDREAANLAERFVKYDARRSARRLTAE